MSEIKEFEKFHPRAVKLMRKRKAFIVIANDEPYYMQAYGLIRQNEMAKETWSPVDEACYTRAAQQRTAADTSAIELLVRIKDKVLTDEDYDADEIVREIDAVLKTAGRS